MIGEYYAMYLLPNPNKGVALHKIKTRLQTYYQLGAGPQI